MENLTHYPVLVFAAAFTALWFASGGLVALEALPEHWRCAE
jgi:hypothetical protein